MMRITLNQVLILDFVMLIICETCKAFDSVGPARCELCLLRETTSIFLNVLGRGYVRNHPKKGSAANGLLEAARRKARARSA